MYRERVAWWLNPPCRPARQPFSHLSDKKTEPQGWHSGSNGYIIKLKDAV